MIEEIPALLFDTRSIQRFIYTGNKLRTNIGASYLVTHVFDQQLVPVLMAEGFTVDADSWKKRLPLEKLSLPQQAIFASNGGGSALVLFSTGTSQDTLLSIVQHFSRQLLVLIPGLHIGAAFGILDPSRFQESLSQLYDKLKTTQNRVFPVVNIPYTGLTLRCPVNGETAHRYEEKSPLSGNQHFFSQETYTKLQASKMAMKELENRLSQDKMESICSRYRFPLELSELGMVQNEKNYFAIVHIDGNNMGLKFQSCQTPEERSQLSEEVAQKTWDSFVRLLESIEDEYGEYLKSPDIPAGKTPGAIENTRPYLPIRPLILGGDDITFVCASSMALAYVRRFMDYLMDPHIGGARLKAAKSIDSCAGIAILKTTYPFFRGYELAEQLCDAAKQKMRATGPSCWLDFAILHGEQAPTLEEIRTQEYTGVTGREGGLHFGPYQVGNQENNQKDSAHYYDLENLLLAVQGFQKGCMSSSNAKELRFALQHGKAAIRQFRAQLEHIGQHLPLVPDWKNCLEEGNDLFLQGRTPYVDAIELLDFLPKGGDSNED